MTARRRSTEGFALIEVLVSLTLLAVGLVAVITAVMTSLDLQKDTALRHRAGLLLRDKLDAVLSGYAGETVQGLSPDGLFAWSIRSAPWAGTEDLRTESRAAETDLGDVPLFEVTVEVRWRTPRAERRLAATQLVGGAGRAEAAP